MPLSVRAEGPGGPRRRDASLELDDPALESDHRGMRAVLGAQLRQDISHLTLDGLLAERERPGDFLVRVALRDEPQDAYLRRRERVVRRMLRQLEGHFRGERLAPGVHRADGVEQLLVQRVLQKVATSAGLE